MRNILLALTTIFSAASVAQGGKCTDPAVSWTVNAVYIDGTTTNAIQGDGSPYINGQSGVAAVINICSGTGDATLTLGSKRSMSISFSKLLASNSNTPSFALSGSTVSGQPNLNVRNLGYIPAGASAATEFTFTTRFNFHLPEKGSWGLHFLNPNVQAPSSDPNQGSANAPFTDSPVNVHHCPANTNTASCPNIVHETWFVWPDVAPTASGTGQTGLPITQVGSLLNLQQTPAANAGEFSVPFYFVISSLQ